MEAAKEIAKTTRDMVDHETDDDKGEKLFRLIETLNEHDDVQNVYANFEVSDALVARMGA